jgi:predicted SAM-dependent methyltransferase
VSVIDALLVVDRDVNIVHCDQQVRVTRYDGAQAAYNVVEAGADLPAILSWFERPARVSGLVERFCEIDPSSLHDAVAQLRAAGILVDAAVPAPAPAAADDEHAATVTSVRSLALRIAEIGDDLHALGPLGLANATGATSLRRRVRLLEAEAELLAATLRARRKPSIDAQLARLGIGPDARDLRLHIGAGTQRLPGWVNVDVFPADLAIDLRWGLPFSDGSARLVYMAHVLEHFNFEEEALFVVRELRRVLQPGGIARIVVPDLEKYFGAYVQRDVAFFAARERHWGASRRASLLSKFLHYAGAGSWPDQREGHKFGYDFELLRELLLEAGFQSVVRSDFMRSNETELRVDDHSWAGAAHHETEAFSLFVDALA